MALSRTVGSISGPFRDVCDSFDRARDPSLDPTKTYRPDLLTYLEDAVPMYPR